MRIDLDLSFINIFFLFLLLGITNPILEELFWRVFLPEVTSQYELSTSAAKSVENQ
jgi:membrane protease YdiL (CAAX protease family)